MSSRRSREDQERIAAENMTVEDVTRWWGEEWAKGQIRTAIEVKRSRRKTHDQHDAPMALKVLNMAKASFPLVLVIVGFIGYKVLTNKWADTPFGGTPTPVEVVYDGPTVTPNPVPWAADTPVPAGVFPMVTPSPTFAPLLTGP